MMGAKAAKLVLPRTYLKAIMSKHPDVPAVVFALIPFRNPQLYGGGELKAASRDQGTGISD
jgi:hypothetical protein